MQSNFPNAGFPPRIHLNIALTVLTTACLCLPVAAQKKVKVFGFYSSYDLTPSLTDEQLDGLTHINYFSVKMPTDGNLTDAYVSSQTNGQRLVDLINRANPKGVKVLLAIGGWGLSNEFAGVAGNATYRKNFGTTAAAFCKNNGLAGIDIDWEFPSAGSNLPLLLDAINAAFTPAGLILTMSCNGEAPQYYGSSALNKTTYILVMAYDMGTPHSSYAASTQAFTTYAGQVTQKSKLMLGVPFYGRNAAGEKNYSELLKMNPSLAPSANEYGGYNFNGPDLIQQKSAYVVDQGGGGMMIWDVGQDALTAAAKGGVLLTAMNKGFTSRNAVLDKVVVGIHSQYHPFSSLELSRGNGFFSFVDGSLTPGKYRLTLFSTTGEVITHSWASLNEKKSLLWPIQNPKHQNAQNALYFRIEKKSKTVAQGIAPQN